MIEKRSAIERTVLLYLLIASLWLFLLERAPGYLTANTRFLEFLQIYQGIGLVVFSAILVYFLLVAETRKWQNRDTASGSDLRNASNPEKVRAMELLRDFDATIERWAQALELRNHEPERHCHRVTEMTLQLGKAFDLSAEELDHIRRGAYLHDIGKMALADSLLLKNGPLSDEERQEMQKHPAVANQLLAGIPFLERALDIPYCHHEKWDGTGYPRGLKGEEIPLSARIFAVVDVWDALTSDRPFRKALPERAALTYIRLQSGTQFDPQVVEKFLQLSKIVEVKNQAEGEDLSIPPTRPAAG